MCWLILRRGRTEYFGCICVCGSLMVYNYTEISFNLMLLSALGSWRSALAFRTDVRSSQQGQSDLSHPKHIWQRQLFLLVVFYCEFYFFHNGQESVVRSCRIFLSCTAANGKLLFYQRPLNICAYAFKNVSCFNNGKVDFLMFWTNI